MDCTNYGVLPKEMAKTDGKETKSLWLAPVMLEERLESLLNLAADLCNESTEHSSDETDELFSNLSHSFRILLNDNAISDRELQMHVAINSKCKKLVELCVHTMNEDSISVLEALTVIFDPNTKFNTFNAIRTSESVPLWIDISDEKLYACPLPDPSNPRGWLVDLINRFGDLGGFDKLLSRFQGEHDDLTIGMIHALLQPFGQCHELLTVSTIVKYLLPIVEKVQVILDALANKNLNEEADIELVNHDLSGIIVAMKLLVSRLPDSKNIIIYLDSLKLRLIFRLIQIVEDINESWPKLDSDFNLAEWNYFLGYFQTLWKTADESSRGKMLKLLQKWAGDYNDSAMIHRVLALLWNLAHSDEISSEILDQAVIAHVEILSYFDDQVFDEQLLVWLKKCIEEFKSNSKWSLSALIQIDIICTLYETNQTLYEYLATESVNPSSNNFIDLVINDLIKYMDSVRQFVEENPDVDETNLKLDGRYCHGMQVETRLDFLTFLVSCKKFPAKLEHAQLLWQCLVDEAVFVSDRERCFDWFSISIDFLVDFGRTNTRDFFKQNVLELDPTLLTPRGIQCFKTFFMDVNKDKWENVITAKSIGTDYLWQVVTDCPEDIARLGFTVLEEMNRNIGWQLKRSNVEIHSIFMVKCMNQLQTHGGTISRISGLKSFKEIHQERKEIVIKTRKISRIAKFMEEYIKTCGWEKKITKG